MTRIWVPGYDEVKDLLERYQALDKNVERAKDRLASTCWKQTSYLIRDPIRAYQEAPAIQRYIELREERNKELSRQIDKIILIEQQVLKLLDTISGIERDVIIWFYIRNMSWIQIIFEIDSCYKKQYSERQCQRFRDSAISKMAPHYLRMSQSVAKQCRNMS